MTIHEASFDAENARAATPPRSLPRKDDSPSAPPLAQAPRSYQDLDGGVGKEVNFRPPRYPSAEFGPVGAEVTVTFGGRDHTCILHDVSQNGVAFEWGAAEPFEVGAYIPQLTVSFDRHEAYRGSARVGSIRQMGGSQLVGASFLDTL